MNTQEIFQNMTKGEMTINHWEKGGNGVSCVSMGEVNYYTGDAVDTPHYGLRIKNEGQFANFPASFEGYHIADIYYQCAPQMGLAIALNMKSAWNNTYGKGINPESVEKMKIYCDAEQQYAETGRVIVGDEIFANNFAKYKLNDLRKEALTAATLH